MFYNSNTKRKIIVHIIIVVVLVSLLIGCKNESDSNELPKYLYNSNGEYIAFIENNYIYDVQTHKAVAVYNKDKKVFYNEQGYYGEIYSKFYFVYNSNSPYIDYNFGTMPTAPYVSMQPLQPQIKSIVLPIEYKEMIHLNITNYKKYIKNINITFNGWAAFYVYLKGEINIDSDYSIFNTIYINIDYQTTYKGYLKSDYSKSKIFNATECIKLNSNSSSRTSIYNLAHKEYGFYEELSYSLTVASVSGTLIKN